MTQPAARSDDAPVDVIALYTFTGIAAFLALIATAFSPDPSFRIQSWIMFGAFLVGFLVMFGGVLLAVTALGASGEVVDPAPQGRGGHGGRGGAPAKSSFTERMEERFRRRFEDR